MNWYCVHTKPLKEAQVAAYCQEHLGLETYLPRLREYRTIRRVRRLTTRPLFPRYLFCHFDLRTDYRSVRYAPDALNLVHHGSVPTPVPLPLIGELKAWAGLDNDIITLDPTLQAGDHVEIIGGPLRGLPAVILRASNDRDRVAILLSVLQDTIPANISRTQLRRVD